MGRRNCIGTKKERAVREMVRDKAESLLSPVEGAEKRALQAL